MRRRRNYRQRRGATAVEGSVVFLVFAGIVLGTLDLGISVFRYHVVSEAARHGARKAIVHGTLAPPQEAQWGPTTVSSAASATGVPLVDAVSPLLVGFDLTKTQITGEWIDGASDPGKRVRVTVTTPFRPIVTFVFGNPSYTLTGSSTMPIAH